MWYRELTTSIFAILCHVPTQHIGDPKVLVLFVVVVISMQVVRPSRQAIWNYIYVTFCILNYPPRQQIS